MRGFCVAAMAAGVLLAGCGDNSGDQSTAGDTKEPAASITGTQPVARTFTKKEFDQYAFNRTKAQIREEFGPPDGIHDDIDEWLYIPSNKSLIVMDPDAGEQVSVSIRFLGLDGSADTVVSVHY